MNINGAADILAAFRERLGIKPRQTTPDDKISLLTARCIGACSLAPAVMVDGEMQGKCDPAQLMTRLEAL